MSMMIFNTLFFLGLFVMFFFILRGQDALLKTLRNELAQTRAKLHLMEMRLAGLLGEDISPPMSMQHLDIGTQEQSTNNDPLHLNLDPQEEKNS